MTRFMTAVTTLALASALAAAPGVSGAWKMNVEGGPHGPATMELLLEQDGGKITGTFVSGHGPDLAVAGEFKDGVLDIATTDGGESPKILFKARLRDDGTLSGTLSSPVGDMRWTASRAADKKDKKKDGR